MKRLFVNLFVTHLLAYASVAFPYAIPTHERLSEEAVKASVLQNDPTVLSNLGLKPPDDKQQQFPNSNREKKPIIELVQDGAGFEDSGIRARNHFYDPVHNRPLTIDGISVGTSSPDWALEDRDTYTFQHDSFRSARQALHDALTEETKEAREQAFGHTFQSLGQVIHHLQDMAQPQHVRNDVHLEVPDVDIPFIEDPSLYEEYTNRQEVRRTLPFSGYDPVSFDTARKFWATGTGQGIAEFTNHNFVSAGTNFRGPIDTIQSDPAYRFPTGHDAQRTVKSIEAPELLGPAQPLRGQMVFIGTPVNDLYVATTTFNTRTSTYSIFDLDLTAAGAEATFTLNRFNFDEAHKFLIPRAVAYSAGLIDYFFRGKIDLTPDSDLQNLGGYLIKNLGTEDMNGTFTLYYDDADGNRHPVLTEADGKAKGWPTTQPIPPQGTLAVASFDRPTNPPPKDANAFMLVFTGKMGAEQPVNGSVGAVVGKQVTVDLSPSFLLLNQYTLTNTTNGWALGQSSTPLLYGNIDWQGEDMTLSFHGPQNRYQSSSFAFSDVIYSQGKVIAIAPLGSLVISAAVETDPIDPTQKRLVAILFSFDAESSSTLSLELGAKHEGVLHKSEANGLAYFGPDSFSSGVMWGAPSLTGNGAWAIDRTGAVCFSEPTLVWSVDEYGNTSLVPGAEWINVITDGDLEALTGVSGPIAPIGVW